MTIHSDKHHFALSRSVFLCLFFVTVVSYLATHEYENQWLYGACTTIMHTFYDVLVWWNEQSVLCLRSGLLRLA